MNKAERQQLAKQLREFSKHYLAKNLKQWRGESSMIKMFRGDAADYRQIATFIRNGKFDAAYRLACNMDTAPRECIPQKVWNAISNQANKQSY